MLSTNFQWSPYTGRGFRLREMYQRRHEAGWLIRVCGFRL